MRYMLELLAKIEKDDDRQRQAKVATHWTRVGRTI